MKPKVKKRYKFTLIETEKLLDRVSQQLIQAQETIEQMRVVILSSEEREIRATARANSLEIENNRLMLVNEENNRLMLARWGSNVGFEPYRPQPPRPESVEPRVDAPLPVPGRRRVGF